MRFSFESRCRLVLLISEGVSAQAAAAACGASRATAYRLWRRYQEGGWAALHDRPPVPKHQPRRCSRELEQRILEARAYAKEGPLIVAGQLGLPASTVWKVLRRYGVSRLQRPARGPIVRYERERPGELVHVDIKKLGRFWTVGKRIYGDGLARNRHAGWQYLHLAIDDHSRLAYAELLPSESPADCVAFLRRATGWHAER
ncbi:MAG: helix-turn-helix domain-containing protein, partial [Thermoleophilia bacterium]|nr:helix-turn-helix domain-containing protein [Thermoleophilia bacterium]